jgi:serine/threonine-protein kinase
VLAQTRGLRVLGSGATARYRDARDPRQIGQDLGASALIDGNVQLGGGRVRITVRLLETAGGVQIWTDRHEGDLGDLFALQESIARRVAEELRLTLTTLHHRGAAPAAAIELYLESRGRLRAFDYDAAAAATACLDRALALAPDFAPALAAHAIACLRSWFLDLHSGETDWEAVARRSVARAVERAPELAETHLAAGILATHGGDYRAAARSIERALHIAPTYADAHEYLGMLQCEAGRADEGRRRLELALSLDPTLMYAGVFEARQLAFAGQWDACEAVLAGIDRRHGPAVRALTLAQRTRVAAWHGDHEALRRCAADDAHQGSPSWRMVRLYAAALTGEMGRSDLRERLREILSATQNPRFLSLTEQLATEVYAALGELDEARLHLMRAATNVLVDLEWLDRCPLLVPLRAHPSFGEARRRVRARAEAVWST